MDKRYHLNDESWNYVVSCFRCRDSEHGLAAAARQIADKWKSLRFGIGKCIIWAIILKNRDLCQRAIRCTSTWRSCIRIFQSTRKRDCKFPKHDLQKLFLHFANSDFCICKIRKLTFANTWPHHFQSLKTIGCIVWCRVFAKSQKTTMKDHAVMKTSFLVRFCLPFTSLSHTRHKLDKRSDEVRLRFSHRGANRPQTHTSVN